MPLKYVLKSDSPYKGGTFHFKLVFPDNFPFKPPSVRRHFLPNGSPYVWISVETCTHCLVHQVTFATKIYHPGFDEEGHICVPILRDQVRRWYPILDLHHRHAKGHVPSCRFIFPTL